MLKIKFSIISILAVLHLWPTQPFAMPFIVIRCAACWHQLATLLQDPSWWAPWDQAGACATKDADRPWKMLKAWPLDATWSTCLFPETIGWFVPCWESCMRFQESEEWAKARGPVGRRGYTAAILPEPCQTARLQMHFKIRYVWQLAQWIIWNLDRFDRLEVLGIIWKSRWVICVTGARTKAPLSIHSLRRRRCSSTFARAGDPRATADMKI